MKDKWTCLNINYAICMETKERYFKGFYDDGCLYDVSWTDSPISGTLFINEKHALTQLRELEEDYPELLLCIVKVKSMSEVSVVNFSEEASSINIQNITK